MKKACILALFLALILSIPRGGSGQDSTDFEKYFVDKTMRIDYYHIGDATSELVTLDRVYEQGTWAGSTSHLIDDMNIGKYFVKVYDFETNRMIFSKGFDSYFGEYITTQKALDGVRRTFHESALIPCPKRKVQFTLESRDKKYVLHRVFDAVIDPKDIDINREPVESDVEVFDFLSQGDPHKKADILFVAEGYAAAEKEKFLADVNRLTRVFFSQEPYASRKSDFNVRGVMKPSQESGPDMPSYGSFKNTAVGTSFDSLESSRYLMTEENRKLRDIAANAPYDALYILVNTSRYGGGGIYNLYCTVVSDNYWTNYVLLHEFGHHFAGLADEYYTSSTSYTDFYPKGQEPVEANITALLNPGELKWKDLATQGIEIPTPWEKEEFDKMDIGYQKVREELNAKIAKAKREKAPEADVKKLEDEAEKLSRENAQKVDAYLKNSKFAGKVGAFEGAGYTSKGLYRPSADCLMFTKGEKRLCKVCEKAVSRMIDYYTK